MCSALTPRNTIARASDEGAAPLDLPPRYSATLPMLRLPVEDIFRERLPISPQKRLQNR